MNQESKTAQNHAVVTTYEAIPGIWYMSEIWGKVLACGTTDPDTWIPAFAVRREGGRTELRFLKFGTLQECPEQSW